MGSMDLKYLVGSSRAVRADEIAIRAGAPFILYLAGFFLATIFASIGCGAESKDADSAVTGNAARVATLAVTDLRDFETQPPEVKRLLARALELTTHDLTYKYGSSDPKEG